jgi:glycosyltransferase involved in cell wall biosynthesis
MKAPAYSILLPTKNRPRLAMLVADSILGQTFKNWELVAVDNSDNSETEAAFASLSDPRIRYHRTGGLSMPQNYETAYLLARGDYVLLCNDKTIWCRNALSLLESQISESAPNFVTWVVGGGRREDDPAAEVPVPFPIEKTACCAVIAHALSCRIDLYQRYAPRATNCAVKRELIESIRSRYGPLCRPVSPDYTFSAFILESCTGGLHFGTRLASMVADIHSNTHVMLECPSPTQGYYATLGVAPGDFLRHVPLPVFLINNLLLDDVLAVINLVRGRVPHICQSEYILMLSSDLALLEKAGRPVHGQAAMVRRYLSGFGLGTFWSLGCHGLKRLWSGWPDRKKKVRENLPAVFSILRTLHKASQ